MIMRYEIIVPSFQRASTVSLFFFTRVSSVLNRDVKQFGKKCMFDEDVETCWNSDQVLVLKAAFIATLHSNPLF
jgi:hypothetical protein